MDSAYLLCFIHCRESHVVFAQALVRSMIVAPCPEPGAGTGPGMDPGIGLCILNSLFVTNAELLRTT